MNQSFLYAVSRVFNNPVEQLWQAWTDAEALEEWYFPTELTSVAGATRSELELGGLWACGVDVSAHGFNAYFFGKYTDIVENQLLKHTMHYTQSPEEFEAKDMSTPSHLIVIDFEKELDGTRVTFSQYGELPEGQAEQAQAGMESYFNSLENYLAK